MGRTTFEYQEYVENTKNCKKNPPQIEELQIVNLKPIREVEFRMNDA